MTTDYLVQLNKELSKLDSDVNCLEDHLNSEAVLRLGVKKFMVSQDIIGIYHQQAWYFLAKEDLILNPPEEADPLTDIRDRIEKEIHPKEKEILSKFKEMKTRAYSYVLDDEARELVDKCIENHPVLNKYVSF